MTQTNVIADLEEEINTIKYALFRVCSIQDRVISLLLLVL